MVLGELPVPRRHTNLIILGQGPTALVIGAGRGVLDSFSLVYHFSHLSPSLRETVRYRLKYCLKGPLNQKQPTKQPTNQPCVCVCVCCPELYPPNFRSQEWDLEIICSK